ncbi:MAG: hypothetical protein R2695_04160 [Acidimicrobiales bacterium]
MLVPAFVAWAGSAGAAAAATLAAAAPIIAVGAAVAGLTAAVIWAYENVDWFRDSVDAVVEFFATDFLPALVAVKDGLVTAFEVAWAVVSPILGAMVSQVSAVISIGRNLIGFLTNVFTGDWRGAWDNIKGIFTGVWDLITAPLDALPGTIASMPGRIASAAAGMFDGIWQEFRKAPQQDHRTAGTASSSPCPRRVSGPLGTIGGWTVGTRHPEAALRRGVPRSALPAAKGLALLRDGERVSASPARDRRRRCPDRARAAHRRRRHHPIDRTHLDPPTHPDPGRMKPSVALDIKCYAAFGDDALDPTPTGVDVTAQLGEWEISPRPLHPARDVQDRHPHRRARRRRRRLRPAQPVGSVRR